LNKELDRNIASLFGENFEHCTEQEVTEIYNLVRKRIRYFYEKSRATQYTICDRCQWTFPRLTEKCTNCGGPLRTFEVPFDQKYKTVDFMAEDDS
jgi:hypothetical protein